MNYINDDYLDSLEPVFNDDISFTMIDILNKFIKEFKIPSILKHSSLESKERTLELDFMFIYDKLIDIFNNIGYIDKLIFNTSTATTGWNAWPPTCGHSSQCTIS